MSADIRLTQAYKKALVKYFDKDSKYVFFSDCHRGDDSASDEFARNQAIVLHALSYYYEKQFVYVEAGDGDDLWEHKNFKYIRSAHMDVFSILKKFHEKKRLIMLYGNHNIYLKDRNYVKENYYFYYNEFKEKQEPFLYKLNPVEGLLLKERITGQEIFVVHGHQGDIVNDRLWYLSMVGVRYFWRFVHLVGIRNPASPAKNQHKRHKMEIKYSKWMQNKDIILICGHTHRMKFPKRNELPYFNIGCCVRSKGITTIELENNKLSLVEWRILAGKEGEMRVFRRVIGESVSIDNWFTKKQKIKGKQFDIL
ncbi:metallophosphoesterase [[Clostridium] polysaccharolyticum]|uniref:Calcineurin-like phosphoesterase superfamily domain-containing protein n=1 Tax=[Clostridium] polysaccharolyticum TaxID=29364 RepID=A0A1I0G6W3_9FIRM|nr:metallophosphoesterase [[Clostridium] polysaccharolyticum]SET66508.1 Calcineurin-like phosphoesterase superfamily domain-containing protein [[Clostridium] polysaccharolyticum]